MPQDDKIAGHSIPNWKATDPDDLKAIANDNIANSNYETPEELKPVPGRCSKCHNPIGKCICNG
ncbi:MAG TPA: hypothetical protein ENH85_11595 [Candidatus Scalindua sp.]|nr:hypothetical protein [Candidatus Scalindua sp.]